MNKKYEVKEAEYRSKEHAIEWDKIGHGPKHELTEKELISFFALVCDEYCLPRSLGEALAMRYCSIQGAKGSKGFSTAIARAQDDSDQFHHTIYYIADNLAEYLNYAFEDRSGSKQRKRFRRIHEHLTFEMSDNFKNMIDQLLSHDEQYWYSKIFFWRI